jgi:hypothetical protein
LKEIKFSFVTDLPSSDERNSLFLKNNKNKGIMKVSTTKYPLEIKFATLKMVRKTTKLLVHSRYIEKYSSK